MGINLRGLLILPLHVWDRELDARLLAAVLIAKQGRPSLIGHEYNISPLYKLNASLFYYGAGRPIFDQTRTCQWYEPLISAGGKVNLVFEEGLNDIRDSSAYSGIILRSLEACSSIYTWHVGESAYMKNASDGSLHLSLDDKCIPCMNTRFEMLGSIGKFYYSGKANSIANIFGDYILVADNFGLDLFGSNSSASALDQIKRNISRLDVSDAKKRELVARYSQSNQKALQSRQLFCKSINSLVSACPNVHFVFRPHPVASPEYWYTNLLKTRNLSIIYKDSVEPWIYSAKAVIHSGCTTGLQAELAGVPAIDISQIYGDTRHLGISQNLSRYSPCTLSQLKNTVSSLPSSRTLKTIGLPGLEEMNINDMLLANLTSINPEVLEKMKSKYSLEIPLVSNTSHLLQAFSDFANNDIATGRDLDLSLSKLNACLGASPPLLSKSRYFSASDIRSRIQSICKILDISVDIVEFTKKNVFLIRPKRAFSPS